MIDKLDPPPRRKLRGLRDQPRVTRFDEPLTDDPQTRQPLMGDSMEQTNQLKKKVLYETKTVKEVRQKQAHVSLLIHCTIVLPYYSNQASPPSTHSDTYSHTHTHTHTLTHTHTHTLTHTHPHTHTPVYPRLLIKRLMTSSLRKLKITHFLLSLVPTLNNHTYLWAESRGLVRLQLLLRLNWKALTL